MRLYVIGVLACGVGAHASGTEVDFYGRLAASAELQHLAQDSGPEAVNNASRIGIKGRPAVTDQISLIYQIEYGADIFDEHKDEPFLTQRDIYLGLSGKWGTIKGGKLSTPLKSIKKEVDLFNDRTGELKRLTTNSNNRLSRVLMYSSPLLASHYAVNLAYIAPKNSTAKDAFSVALTYDNRHHVALAYDSDVEKPDVRVLRLVNRYRFEPLTVAGLFEYQWGKSGGMRDGYAWLVSARYTAGKLIFKMQDGVSEIHQQLTALMADKGQNFSIGLDYQLRTTTKLFTYYTKERSDRHTLDNDYFGVGFEYNF